jgi:hypothetical protein
MNGGTHISQEDLALYAMHQLRDEELEAVRGHLPTCAECREQLNAIAGDLTWLAMSVEQQPVPAHARQRFIDSISAEAPPAAATPSAPVPISTARPAAKTAWIPWTIAAALAVTAGGLGLKNNTLHQELSNQSLQVMRSAEESVKAQRVQNLLMATSAQRATLTVSKAVAQPTGHAIYLAERGELIFQGNNLKALPDDKTYELWIIPANGTASIPAGTFRPDKSGDASVVLPPLPVGVTAKAFGVTIERAEGSATPTSPILLAGAPSAGE